tara:strand:- start:2761 stop:6405 length:3645 start_codon:yes stop_codon:yes gene_type:complete
MFKQRMGLSIGSYQVYFMPRTQSMALAILMLLGISLAPLLIQSTDNTAPHGLSEIEDTRFSPGATTDFTLMYTQSSGVQGGPGSEHWVKVNDVIVDSNDDIYAVGAFANNVTIGSSDWDEDWRTGFIAKFDDQGNSIWELMIEGPPSSYHPASEIMSIDVDNAGRVFVGGMMCGTATFTSASSCGWNTNWAGFVAKVSPQGIWEWGVSIDGSSGNEVVNDVAIRSDGHVYAVGEMRTSAFFEAVSYNTSGRIDGFVTLVDTINFDFDWVRFIGSQSHTEYDNATSVMVDSADNAIVTGTYSDNSGNTFGTSIIMPVGRPNAAYVLNLSSTNTINWVAGAGGSANVEPVYAHTIIDGGDGHYYVAGSMGGVTTFDSAATQGQVSLVANGTSEHAFIAQMGTDGAWNYARRSDSPDGFSNWAHQTVHSIAMGQNGMLIATGQFDSPNTHPISEATFGSTRILDSYMGGFLVGFNTQTATFAWAKSFGSGGDNVRGNGVSILSDGRIVTGIHACPSGPCYVTIDGVQTNMVGFEGGGGFVWTSFPDSDSDGVADKDDNCDLISNPTQDDIDADNLGDACDPDIDGDAIINVNDNCDKGAVNWDSSVWMNDRDGDGCRDSDEDSDDDGDGVDDSIDTCSSATHEHNWTSSPASDYDADGCKDTSEDDDDDADTITDILDQCASNPSWKNWTSNANTDHDGDGCKDEGEDMDDDNDQRPDDEDSCQTGLTGWTSEVAFDYDLDGCRDSDEDLDDDNDLIPDVTDDCNPPGANGWTSVSETDHDGDGCRDADEDSDDDNDGIPDEQDTCPKGQTNWIGNDLTFDNDGDGCKDTGAQNNGYGEDIDDDGDQILDVADSCPSGEVGWTSNFGNDFDRDGCKDDTEDEDDDGDGFLEENGEDKCPLTTLGEPVDLNGCAPNQGDSDGDGLTDQEDQCPDEDARGFDDNLDGCIDDTDSDGINDAEDLCLDTPADESGTVEQQADGCTITERDLDGDGVKGDEDSENGFDICPSTPPDAEVDNFGCSADQQLELIDSDEDGINDLIELNWLESSGYDCSSTIESDVDENGCGFSQLDADNDGIQNIDDICPGTPNLFSVDEDGCSISQKQDLSTDGGGMDPIFVAAIIIVAALLLGSVGVAVVIRSRNKPKPRKKKARPKAATTAPAPGAFAEEAAEALAPEPTPLPELSGHTTDEDGVEWAKDASGNWYWRNDAESTFALYES